MRRRRVAGVTCPRCKQPAHRMSDGTLSEHRTEYNAIGSNQRERCSYSGGAELDAHRKITPLMRRTQAYILAKLECEGREPNERERKALDKIQEREK